MTTLITVTAEAAQQVRVAATRSGCDEMGLRIAVRRDADGSLHYAMGFDDAGNDDVVVASEGVALVVASAHRELLDGMTLDFVEYEPGDFRFIFINPNEGGAEAGPDPQVDGGCGGACSCGGGR